MIRVILKETIESLGIVGSEVAVKNGYARNYLLPQKKAILANDANRRAMKHERVKVDLQIAKEKAMAEEMAKSLSGVVCRITAKVSEEDRLYGSVGVRDIMDSLDAQGITVERRMVLLKDSIKTLGTYQVPIRVYRDVEPEITIEVVTEE